MNADCKVASAKPADPINTPSRPRARQSMRQIFSAPLVFAALTTTGLIAALVGDGPWDGLSWVTLAAPVAAFAFFMGRRRHRDSHFSG